jgi:hypothetical protein
MNATDIIDVLSQTAQQTGGLALSYGTRFEQNHDGDSAQFPKVYLDEPLTSYETLRSAGNTNTVYSIKLFFANKANLDATPQQQRATIVQMRSLAKEFIVRLQQQTHPDGRKVFNLVAGAQFTLTDVVNLPYDVGLTGVLMEMDLPVFDYNPICIV